MKYNVFTYLVGEGFSNIFKNKKQAFTSFGTMCLIMIFFGLCFIIVGNFNHFIKLVESQQGIQAFVKKDATEEEIEEVQRQINEIEEVNTIEFVSQEQALQSVKDRIFQERSDLLEGYDVSIFKPSYKITLTDITKTSEVKEKLSQIENVVKVTNTDDVIEVLIKVARRNKNRKLCNNYCFDSSKYIYNLKYNKTYSICSKKRNFNNEICWSNKQFYKMAIYC